MSVFERQSPGTRALNAAPCYLQVDQTAFLAKFLLERMPQVSTVLVVLAPRDFEACRSEDTAFFEPRLADAYISGTLPGWVVHLAGFRPVWLAREVMRVRQARVLGPERVFEDAFGSSVSRQPGSYWPEPTLDPNCNAALTRLEGLVVERGARLVVATVPVMPRWAAEFDTDGRLIEAWTRRLAAALRRPESVLVDGRGLDWGDDRFADPVHVLYPNHSDFSEFVAAALQARRRESEVRS